jgi:hypothetical protein
MAPSAQQLLKDVLQLHSLHLLKYGTNVRPLKADISARMWASLKPEKSKDAHAPMLRTNG